MQDLKSCVFTDVRVQVPSGVLVKSSLSEMKGFFLLLLLFDVSNLCQTFFIKSKFYKNFKPTFSYNEILCKTNYSEIWTTCVASGRIIVTVNVCTGINEKLPKSNSIYPNPNNGEFTLELNETIEVIIANISGSVLLNSTLNIGKQTLANGIYFVQLIIDGKQQTIKLIKE